MDRRTWLGGAAALALLAALPLGPTARAAEVTERVEPGLIFSTFHFPESAANFLTNPAKDPVAKIPEFKVCAVRVEAA